MKKKKKDKKNKIVINLIFNIIAIISTIIALIFSIYVYKLDMLPEKYLTIIFIALGLIYLILLLLTFPRKIKRKFKYISALFLIIFGVLFSYGITYIDKTISFIDIINDELKQKEEYYVTVLEKSKITKINELNSKKLGVYSSETSVNSKKAIELLNKKFKGEVIKYEDIVDMFEEFSEEKVDALLINDSQKDILSSDLAYLNITLRDLDTIMVPIDDVEEVVKVVDVTNTPFNIYIAGGDAYGNISKVTNTDVNMIVSVDPINHKLLLTSIPRDYYVNFPSKGENAYDKLTHAGYYGIQESIKAIENLLAIDINYYVKVNFSTVEGVVDAIGGINIYSDKKFCAYGCPNICYKKGDNQVNGHFALMFARERHAYSEGDVHRVKNQQTVLTAILEKVMSSKTLISKYKDILSSMEKSFATSMDTKSINRLVKMQLNDMRGWSIETQNLTGFDLYTKGTYTFPKLKLYVMKQDPNSIKKAQDKINAFFGTTNEIGG